MSRKLGVRSQTELAARQTVWITGISLVTSAAGSSKRLSEVGHA